MRCLVMLCVLLGLALLPCVAIAADAGQVSDTTLAQIGLGGLQTVSDVQGLAIRGSGFAAAGGYSTAVWKGAKTSNAYIGVSKTKKAEAGGATSSFAGSQTNFAVDVASPRLTGSLSVTVTRGVIAVGSSSAYAK